MFSELCRETLRKAAVCYSSARAGSPSPSPPTSPPSSPAKEAKTAANADVANVRDASHEGAYRDHHHSGTIGGRRATSPAGNAAGESRDPDRSVATDRSNDFREYVYTRCEAHTAYTSFTLGTLRGDRSSIEQSLLRTPRFCFDFLLRGNGAMWSDQARLSFILIVDIHGIFILDLCLFVVTRISRIL